jgi:hypothetical protein
LAVHIVPPVRLIVTPSGAGVYDEKMNFSITIRHAREAAAQHRLGAWVDEFLTSEGGNAKLAQALQEHSSAQVMFVEFPLAQLRRVMGPEESMIWREDPQKWTRRVEAIRQAIRSGHDVPPLIATDFWDDLHLSDGNHRHEALRQLGVEKYWTIFCLEDPSRVAWVNEQLAILES